MMRGTLLASALSLTCFHISCNSWNQCNYVDAFAPMIPGRSLKARETISSLVANQGTASNAAPDLKENLLERLDKLQKLRDRDGDFSIDFGVKGGELNATSRAPRMVDYYSISESVGQAADEVLHICESLSKVSPCLEPTQYLGDKLKGSTCPLNGSWRQLFTTAADAVFSKNSTRGAASAKVVIDATRGKITNVIDFASRSDGTEPVLKQLNVVLRATAASKTRVNLRFRYVKAVLTKFFFLPLFGRKLVLYIPVPGPFLTRIIFFFSRLLRFVVRKGDAANNKLPEAYFDVLYLDESLRIQRTGEGNIFVQAKETWDAARPLLR